MKTQVILSLNLLVALFLFGCSKNKSQPEPSSSEKEQVQAKAKAEPQKAKPGQVEPETSEPLPEKPVVELSTTMGQIKIELFPKKVPLTVANFIKYVRAGHYNGTIFHRVISSFMIQGGGFDSQYSEKPTNPPIRNEADNGLTNDRGTVAMARTPDPHSASAQFFINVVDNQKLDHRGKTLPGWGYCVFGKVIEGMDTVDKIKALPTGSKGPFPTDVPQTDVVINEAKVVP